MCGELLCPIPHIFETRILFTHLSGEKCIVFPLHICCNKCEQTEKTPIIFVIMIPKFFLHKFLFCAFVQLLLFLVSILLSTYVLIVIFLLSNSNAIFYCCQSKPQHFSYCTMDSDPVYEDGSLSKDILRHWHWIRHYMQGWISHILRLTSERKRLYPAGELLTRLIFYALSFRVLQDEFKYHSR